MTWGNQDPQIYLLQYKLITMCIQLYNLGIISYFHEDI